ncbi:MAG: non-homologous end-joining DNA ligase [Chitinophagales bacterium]
MLATIGKGPFDGEDWIFEMKFDGYRAIAEMNGRDVKLYSRNGLDFQKDYPAVFDALKKLNGHAILDGEIVALDKNDKPSFQLLQQIGDNPSIPLYYYVFDLLELNGKEIQQLPLIQRKELLQKLLKKNKVIRYSDHVEREGKKFFKLIVRENLEGMIAKRSSGIYETGRRTTGWLKIKYHHEQEAIIVGFTDPQGGRKFFGSLLLAVNKNRKLHYTGNAGTGFNDKTLKELYDKMKPLITDHSPFTERIVCKGHITWIRPMLVANIKFSEWTQDEHMRHPVFMGLRKDKSAAEVIRE